MGWLGSACPMVDVTTFDRRGASPWAAPGGGTTQRRMAAIALSSTVVLGVASAHGTGSGDGAGRVENRVIYAPLPSKPAGAERGLPLRVPEPPWRDRRRSRVHGPPPTERARHAALGLPLCVAWRARTSSDSQADASYVDSASRVRAALDLVSTELAVLQQRTADLAEENRELREGFGGVGRGDAFCGCLTIEDRADGIVRDWWAMTDSNRRPTACKAAALPLS